MKYFNVYLMYRDREFHMFSYVESTFFYSAKNGYAAIFIHKRHTNLVKQVQVDRVSNKSIPSCYRDKFSQ